MQRISRLLPNSFQFQFLLQFRITGWFSASWCLALLLFAPILALGYTAIGASDEIFTQLADTVLTDYVLNTLYMVVGVCFTSLLLGLPLAWLMAMCDFPAKRFFSWALVLPLAMPAYVIAYIYTDLFDYAGPVQIVLRNWFDWQQPADYWFFDIRSLPGAVIVLSLVLYPYVYLLLRSAFANSCKVQVQASRLLGDSAWRSFWRISLPQMRGVIVAALALVGMETLADFATVHYFAINTMTTAVYDTWLGYYSLPAAAKLSVLMLVLVFALLALEKYQRRGLKTYSRNDSFSQGAIYALTGYKAWFAFGYSALIFFFGFLLPTLILLNYGIDYFDVAWNDEFLQYGWQSLIVASVVAIFCVAVALVANFSARQQQGIMASQLTGPLMSFGYALPGTVLAIAVIIPMTTIEVGINEWLEPYTSWQPGLFMTGSIVAIVFAYVVRFSAIPIGSIREGLDKISPTLDQASRSMGSNFSQTTWRIHIPLLKKVMLTSGLLVFIEAMKELPAALLLRPFGFETLATYVYQYVSDEQLEHASLAAISIVLVGLIPLIFVNKIADSQQYSFTSKSE